MIDAELARDIWRKLFFISGRLRNVSYSVLEEMPEWSLAQFPIVQFYFTYPEAIPTVKDLSAYIGLPPGAVSQAVDALVEKNMLVRVPSPYDRRSMTVRVTEELLNVREGAFCFSRTCWMLSRPADTPRRRKSP